MTSGRTSERGAALLIVMVAVAVLTVLAADLAYEARVSLQIAANARNELQATYLAKGGVALSRLVLQFQRELDDTMQAPAAGGQGMGFPRPQVWKIAPVNAELADALFGGAFRTRPEAAAAGAAPAGGPAAGAFQVDIDDEGRKVNFQLDALDKTSSALLAAQVQAIWQLVCDPTWDPLFDREDANGTRVSRTDLLSYLRDWVDEDSVSSALAPTVVIAGCAIAIPQSVFESGFGDENFPYDRGEDRYRAKNARMDSLDELYLLAGIGDAFMGAFGDQVTVYLARDDKPNINSLDPRDILRNAQGMAATGTDQPRLRELAFLETVQKALYLATFGGNFAISPAQFGQIVADAGVAVDPSKTAANGPFVDRSSVFRLRSTGRAGDVTKTLDVVVRMDKTQGVVVTPGKILHWREE